MRLVVLNVAIHSKEDEMEMQVMYFIDNQTVYPQFTCDLEETKYAVDTMGNLYLVVAMVYRYDPRVLVIHLVKI
jgi:hypothetical protein